MILIDIKEIFLILQKELFVMHPFCTLLIFNELTQYLGLLVLC